MHICTFVALFSIVYIMRGCHGVVVCSSSFEFKQALHVVDAP